MCVCARERQLICSVHAHTGLSELEIYVYGARVAVVPAMAACFVRSSARSEDEEVDQVKRLRRSDVELNAW